MAEAIPIKVAIAKGGGTVEVLTTDLPDEVYAVVLSLGLKDLMNRGMTKIKSPKNLTGDDAEKAKAAAMEQAEKNLVNLKAGKLPRIAGVATAKDSKIPGVVMTEARRLARNLIKDEIKATGGKISHYEAKEITNSANVFLTTEEGKVLLEQARANVDARNKAVEEKPKATLADLEAKLGISVSAAKVKEAEAKKAKSKAAGDAVLSAAQAGKVKVRSAKPGKGAPANA